MAFVKLMLACISEEVANILHRQTTTNVRTFYDDDSNYQRHHHRRNNVL